MPEEEEFLAGIEQRPETYKTLLKEESQHTTAAVIASRRISRLVSEDKLFKYVLEGTRKGVQLFFSPQKKYLIMIRRTRQGFSHYYCSECLETEGGVLCKNVFQLVDEDWQPAHPSGSIIIPYNEVFRCF